MGGLRIVEVPVVRSRDPDSRVDIVRTVLQDIRELLRLALLGLGLRMEVV